MAKENNNYHQIADFQPNTDKFLAEVRQGLAKTPKELPTKYLYDERGSRLYESICTLEEYYIPGVETGIMRENIGEITGLLGGGANLIEYGCGSCTKTRILLDNMPDLAAYIHIDISGEQLHSVSEQLNNDYPGLEIFPVCADYTCDFQLIVPVLKGRRNVVYYPGSSIGNFGPESGRALLKNIAGVCRTGGALLIGIDLQKDPAVLHRAYNDSQGITAAFNLNLLERINRELNGDFNPECFEHNAFYNPEKGRVEMHLVSRKDQTVRLNNSSVFIAEGETIWTESSYKYTPSGFAGMASDAGFTIGKAWTDAKGWFSVLYLVVSG